jgi:PKD repeat protein
MHKHRLLTGVLLFALLATPMAAFAQDGLTINVTTSQACGVASFDVTGSGGVAPYSLTWDFGDGEAQLDAPVAGFPFSTQHTYGAGGTFSWTLLAADASAPALQATAGGTLTLGPQVALTSDPFPPLLTLENGQALITFTATASGGEPPYTYAWDLNNDGTFEPGTDTATFTYTAGGKYAAAVQVTDNCGLTSTATLTVVVVDPEAEACQPMAQRIADGVNSLFPTQAGQLYTCEDILALFQGSLTGHNLGFGRMWHAYQLASVLEDMTWEEILQWHLDGNGWGLLVQLDRFAKTLGDIGPGQLADMVLKGEASVGEIRTALRMTTRYGADFTEALDRAHAGANAGQLNQFYRAASDLGLDPAALDGYLEEGMSVAELRHAARVAAQSGAALGQTMQAHLDGLSWGEINQAARQGAKGGDVPAAIETQRREHQRHQQDADQSAQYQFEQNLRTAAQLAHRYRVSVGQVQSIFNGACSQDWACVQATFESTVSAPHGNGGRGGGHK